MIHESEYAVSVVIPTYNRESTLERALLSVLGQDFDLPFEVWVVDDASTDGTEALLSRFGEQGDPPIHYRRLSQNKGVSAARNEGIRASSGKFLAFLDSDDEWLPNRLRSQWELLEKNDRLKIIYGEEIWIRHGVRVNQRKKHQKSGGDIFLKCLPLCLIGPSAVLIAREVFTKLGTFNELFPVCEDYELWLRITAHYQVGFVSDPIIKKYGGHGDQLSRKYEAMDLWRVRALGLLLDSAVLNGDCDPDGQKRRGVLTELALKCGILLKGHAKHGRLEGMREIQERWEQAMAELGDDEKFEGYETGPNLVS